MNAKGKTKGVVVVAGAGGIVQAIARPAGASRTILIANHTQASADAAAEVLEATGFETVSMQGDSTDVAALTTVMSGHDVAYANPAGEMKVQAECTVQTMPDAGLNRLLFISSMGIYGEVPGKRYERVLDPYRYSAR